MKTLCSESKVLGGIFDILCKSHYKCDNFDHFYSFSIQIEGVQNYEGKDD